MIITFVAADKLAKCILPANNVGLMLTLLLTYTHLECYSFKKLCHFVRTFLLLHYHHIVSITWNDVYNKEKANNCKVCCHPSSFYFSFSFARCLLLSLLLCASQVHIIMSNNHKRNIRFSSKTYANKLIVVVDRVFFAMEFFIRFERGKNRKSKWFMPVAVASAFRRIFAFCWKATSKRNETVSINGAKYAKTSLKLTFWITLRVLTELHTDFDWISVSCVFSFLFVSYFFV